MASNSVMEAPNEIVDYMDYAGIPYERSGKWAWPLEFDSMRINVQKNYYNRYSTGSWGHLEEFIGDFYGIEDPKEIRKRVQGFKSTVDPSKYKRPHHIEPPHVFHESELNASNRLTDRSMNYLVGERKLSPNMIKILAKRNLVLEDKRHNVIFAWQDRDNKIIGADIQGTFKRKDIKPGQRDHFKGIAAGSPTDHGFSVFTGRPSETRTAIIFEAPIDALSYWQMHYETLTQEPAILLSTSGATKVGVVSKQLADRLPEGQRLKHFVIAVDNDEAGHKFVQKIKDTGILAEVATPSTGKDWNESLQQGDYGQKIQPIGDWINPELAAEEAEKKLKEKEGKKIMNEENNAEAKETQTATPEAGRVTYLLPDAYGGNNFIMDTGKGLAITGNRPVNNPGETHVVTPKEYEAVIDRLVNNKVLTVSESQINFTAREVHKGEEMYRGEDQYFTEVTNGQHVEEIKKAISPFLVKEVLVAQNHLSDRPLEDQELLAELGSQAQLKKQSQVIDSLNLSWYKVAQSNKEIVNGPDQEKTQDIKETAVDGAQAKPDETKESKQSAIKPQLNNAEDLVNFVEKNGALLANFSAKNALVLGLNNPDIPESDKNRVGTYEHWQKLGLYPQRGTALGMVVAPNTGTYVDAQGIEQEKHDFHKTPVYGPSSFKKYHHKDKKTGQMVTSDYSYVARKLHREAMADFQTQPSQRDKAFNEAQAQVPNDKVAFKYREATTELSNYAAKKAMRAGGFDLELKDSPKLVESLKSIEAKEIPNILDQIGKRASAIVSKGEAALSKVPKFEKKVKPNKTHSRTNSPTQDNTNLPQL